MKKKMQNVVADLIVWGAVLSIANAYGMLLSDFYRDLVRAIVHG